MDSISIRAEKRALKPVRTLLTAAKAGSIHLLCDQLGLPLTALISAANVHDSRLEACLSWPLKYRRLVRRYDRKAEHFQAFTDLACAQICYRRLTKLTK